VVFCGAFLALLVFFSVLIGIYQVLWSRFLRAKRGQIVVNCVADVEARWWLGVDGISLLRDLVRQLLDCP
jgi:hypothetical protein